MVEYVASPYDGSVASLSEADRLLALEELTQSKQAVNGHEIRKSTPG
jgi:hypothetical protein